MSSDVNYSGHLATHCVYLAPCLLLVLLFPAEATREFVFPMTYCTRGGKRFIDICWIAVHNGWGQHVIMTSKSSVTNEKWLNDEASSSALIPPQTWCSTTDKFITYRLQALRKLMWATQSLQHTLISSTSISTLPKSTSTTTLILNRVGSRQPLKMLYETSPLFKRFDPTVTAGCIICANTRDKIHFLFYPDETKCQHWRNMCKECLNALIKSKCETSIPEKWFSCVDTRCKNTVTYTDMERVGRELPAFKA